MNKGQIEYAERQALKLFDEWNEVTGCFDPPATSGWYHELVEIIKDAVHCGIQTVMFGDVKTDEDGEVIRHRVENPDDEQLEKQALKELCEESTEKTEQFLNDLEEFEEKSKQTSIRVNNRIEREKRLEALGFEKDLPFSIGSFPEQLNYKK